MAERGFVLLAAVSWAALLAISPAGAADVTTPAPVPAAPQPAPAPPGAGRGSGGCRSQ